MNEIEVESYFNFLEELRLSGRVNMYESPTHLAAYWYIPLSQAKHVFNAWVETYNAAEDVDKRVAIAFDLGLID